VEVNLGEELGNRSLTIELWYWFDGQRASAGRLILESPQLSGASRPERAYWQLKLPANRHLVWASAGLVSENRWRWKGVAFVREPGHSQADLERWVQAGMYQPDTGFNSYVFSSVGISSPQQVLAMTRSFAVLSLAGGAFAAGVLLLYLPVLRHPLLLLSLGCLTAAMAIAFPDPSIAAAQVLVAGIALLVLTRLLMAVMARQPVRQTSLRGSSYGFSEARSTQGSARRSDSRVATGAALAGPVASSSLQMSATGDDA
jgi:hypothetical protein